MRTFTHFNQSGEDVCPVCKTNEDKEVILVPIAGTEEGNNIQAIQVHTRCLQNELMYYPELNILVINCGSIKNTENNKL
jgi:hypothetical protein